jgi:hypothetical protein
MIRHQEKRVSAFLLALTLFLFAGTADGDPISGAEDPFHSLDAMIDAGRNMIKHINTAATSGDLAKVRRNANEGARYGAEMMAQARTSLNQVRTMAESSGMDEKSSPYLKQAIQHLEEAIKHGQSAVMHAHHAVRSKTLRSSLSHARESAKHARISALYALEGEGYARSI